jgi:2-polyprenyl-3-methyl-5-hydroxy-6-metoxy-1,4-benzoquinol methylase
MTENRYEAPIDLSVDNAHTRVLRLVGEGKQVLELGCAAGHMSRFLVTERGCTVTAVERDEEAAAEARKVVSRLILGDLDTLELSEALPGARFDAILCADVLEHLKDPVRVLRGLRPLVAPGGFLVASVPNIAHVSVLAELLEGRFRYRPLGLLDETHLRFFTRDSLLASFEQGGFDVTHLERLPLEPEATEFRTDLGRFPAELARLLRAHDESTTYSFILKAVPAARDAPATGAPRPPGDPIVWPRRPAATEDTFWRGQVEGLIGAILARARHLESEREWLTAEVETLRGQRKELGREISTHVEHVRFLQDEVARRDAAHEDETARREAAHRDEAARLREEFAAVTATLKAHLADIESGAGWRLLTRLRRARLVACPPGSRRERLWLAAVGSGRSRRP